MTPFHPSPDITSRILDDLCDPDLTLRDIAQKARTSVDALSIWMASPDIQARINLIQSTMAQRTRLTATCYLPSAVRTVNRLIDEYNDEESHVHIRPGSLMGHEYRRRSRESARRACNLLLRLARFSHQGAPSASSGPRPCTPPAPDLISERASRVSGRSSSLQDLLAKAAEVAPGPSALSGAAGAAAPAPSSPDCDSAPPSREQDDTPHPRAVEVAILHPDPGLAPPPAAVQTNGNGHALTTSNNEHWP